MCSCPIRELIEEILQLVRTMARHSEPERVKTPAERLKLRKVFRALYEKRLEEVRHKINILESELQSEGTMEGEMRGTDRLNRYRKEAEKYQKLILVTEAEIQELQAQIPSALET